MIDVTCLLTALVGFAVGVLWQEIHFADVGRALRNAEARMAALERRLEYEEDE